MQKSKGPLNFNMQDISFEDKEASLDQISPSPITKKRQTSAHEKRKRMGKSKTTQISQNSKISEQKNLTVTKTEKIENPKEEAHHDKGNPHENDSNMEHEALDCNYIKPNSFYNMHKHIFGLIPS